MKHYARLTIDMTPEEHTDLKIASAQLGISMRKFMLLGAFQMMKALDDDWLSARAEERILQMSCELNQHQQIGDSFSPLAEESDISLTCGKISST